MTEERLGTGSGMKGNLLQSPTGGPWGAEAYNTDFAFVWEFATDLLSMLGPKRRVRRFSISAAAQAS